MVNKQKGKSMSRVAKLEKKVRKIASSQEVNYSAGGISEAIAYDTDTTTQLTVLTASGGGGAGSRIGRMVTPRSIEIRGYFNAQASATAEPDTPIRMIVIQAKQRFTPQTSAVTSGSSVLMLQGTGSAVHAPYDHDNRKHFTVLYDRTFDIGYRQIGTGVTGSGGAQIKSVSLKLFPKRKVMWEELTATEEGGHVYLLFYSRVATTSTEPTFTGTYKFNYDDA